MKYSLLLIAALASAQDSYLIRNATIHPVTGPEIANGSLLIENGKITGIGAKLVAPKGVKIVEAKGMHAWPGMINCATQIGISEVSSVRETNDTNEIGEFIPQVRAVVAVNPETEHIPVARANGLTAVLTLPAAIATGGGPGASTAGQSIVRGQAAMLRLDGWTWEDLALSQSAGMLVRFPAIQTVTFAFPAGRTEVPYAEAKRRYDGEMRKIDEFFEKCRRYQQAKKAATPNFQADVQLEAMLPVLEGRTPLLIAAQRERGIREAIDFCEKHKVKLVLMDVRKPGAQLARLAEKKIPVIVGQPTDLPMDEDDDYDAAYALPAVLHKAGVKFAFATYDNQFARNLPFEAGYAVAYGLPMDAAWKALTIDAAEIFGVGEMTGSLEKGKSADLLLSDGDPLEVRTQIKMLFIRGKNVSLENRQTRLYQKYLARP
ncbi:MAG: amidohydrolase family protein [Bryobacteraceae bacterium]|nr:amidohydrolase family protein [Bryobacteraceae bacterium]